MESGIYKITDLKNNKAYIGRAVDLRVRKWRHYCFCQPEKYSKDSLKTEINMKIHQAMMKDGHKENFSFEVLEYCNEDQLNEKEQYYIKLHNTLYPNGYNDTIGGNSYPHCKGEEHHNHKLTQIQVDQIYDLLINGKTTKEIQQIIPEATMSTISAINTGRNWRKENYNYPLSRLNGVIKLNDDDVLKIRQLWEEGNNIRTIAKIYNNVSENTIGDIVRNKTHKNVPLAKQPSSQANKGKFSEDEVNQYRKMYFIDKKTITEIYNYYCSIKDSPVGRSSFLDMIKGRSYSQFKVYKEEKKPYEETRRGKEAVNRQQKQNRNETIKELFNKGITKQEIANQVGCSVRTVYRVIEKNDKL